jgi:hypothetical protein
MMRDSAELGPVAQRGDGGLFVFGKNPAGAQSDDVRELAVGGVGELRFHTPVCRSRAAAGRNHAGVGVDLNNILKPQFGQWD